MLIVKGCLFVLGLFVVLSVVIFVLGGLARTMFPVEAPR